MEVNNKIYSTSNNITNEISHNIKNQNNNKEHNKVDNKENNSSSEKNGISKERLDKLVDELNEKFKLVNKEFSYDIHEKTNRVIVKIKDSESGDVIRELPSEESLDLAAKIKEMVGLIIDKKS
ncbi:flagellar protein FlaG [[Clostridium] colinum]|uniref:flagellar protein FlaG n=1 Tax=[Clostridium] colinum TaxID=36835 RepID=UPI002024AE9C|nr:flagellar protein FlaG [[Clostridium] colinum]